MNAALFHMRQAIPVIKAMGYAEMNYWYSIHQSIQAEHKKQADALAAKLGLGGSK